MVCIDKGDTKFPGGLIAKYYKPIRWHTAISDIPETLQRLEINSNKELDEYIKQELDFFKILKSIKSKSENFKIIDYCFESNSDISLKFNDKYIAYTNGIGPAFRFSYIHYLRNSNIDNYNDLFEALLLFKNYYDKECVPRLIA